MDESPPGRASGWIIGSALEEPFGLRGADGYAFKVGIKVVSDSSCHVWRRAHRPRGADRGRDAQQDLDDILRRSPRTEGCVHGRIDAARAAARAR